MRAGEPFGAPEGVRLKRYSRSEIDIPNGRLATLCEGWAALCPRCVTIDDAFGKVEADVYNKLWGAAQLGGEFPAAVAGQLGPDCD